MPRAQLCAVGALGLGLGNTVGHVLPQGRIGGGLLLLIGQQLLGGQLPDLRPAGQSPGAGQASSTAGGAAGGLAIHHQLQADRVVVLQLGQGRGHRVGHIGRYWLRRLLC